MQENIILIQENLDDMNEDKSALIMVILIILVFCIGISGIIVKHKDVLIKEDTEYL